MFLLKAVSENAVFVLSFGFLVHEDLDDLTRQLCNIIQKEGISVLLLPSKTLATSTRDISNFISLLPGATEESSTRLKTIFQPIETPLETGKENGLITDICLGINCECYWHSV